MGFDPNGMHPVNQFALVIYIPDPLGRFLDDLRRELAPGCVPHAHVSVLPPRPISRPWQLVSEEARACACEFAPFDVEAGGMNVFEATEVVYLEVIRGGEELCRMHAALGCGDLQFDEPYAYHPHITLAQEIPHEELPAVVEMARRKWGEYSGPRWFRAEKATFVQNTSRNRWIDLAEFSLGAVPVLSAVTPRRRPKATA